MSHAPRGWFYGGKDQPPYWDGWVWTGPFQLINEHTACALWSPRARETLPWRAGQAWPPAAAGVLGSSPSRTTKRGDE